MLNKWKYISLLLINMHSETWKVSLFHLYATFLFVQVEKSPLFLLSNLMNQANLFYIFMSKSFSYFHSTWALGFLHF